MWLFFHLNCVTGYTQGNNPVPTAGTDAKPTVIVQPGFKEIVFGNGAVNLLIWGLIFLASFAAVTFICDGFSLTRKTHLLPDDLISGVTTAIDENDVDAAKSLCEANPGPLSYILLGGFSHVDAGWEAVQEAVEVTTEIESEKTLQRISYLNLCGQISPMLGLLGTVVGMVKAFSGLAGEAGAAKAQLLALAISGALWTTVAGLLISVLALTFYTIFKNMATKHLLHSQQIVLTIFKHLRDL
jgi:biopolymer transport protein ExbB